MIKVIVVDDQIILREGIKFRIDSDDEIKVVGSAGNGIEAMELCDRFLPDVVLMDIMMPICDGIEATKRIKLKYNSIKVIILTIFIDNENITKAMKNGADGYVLKDIDPKELINIIKNTASGLRIIHQDVLDTLVSDFALKDKPAIESSFDLSEKELEIIKWIVHGKSTREVASLVFLSEGRVRNIISDILSKLDLKDRVQLAVFAVKNDLI